MSRIKLKCRTAGYKSGDIVSTGKDTISEKDAKLLIKDGLAELLTEKPDADAKVDNKKVNALELKVKGLEDSDCTANQTTFIAMDCIAQCVKLFVNYKRVEDGDPIVSLPFKIESGLTFFDMRKTYV